MASEIRTSQRAPKACVRCARMRIKCDKRIPCQTCVMRGLESSCTRETVRVRGKIIATNPGDAPPTYAELLEENRRLKLSLDRSLDIHARATGHRSFSFVEAFESEIQDVHLKRSTQVRTAADIYIPTRACSRALLEHGTSWTSWIHFAVHVPSFNLEHDKYWKETENNHRSLLDQDPLWLAIYFAFIAMSLLFMNEEEAEVAGLQRANIIRHVENWYDASLFFLEKADFLRNHDFRTVQAIAILLGLFKNVGDSGLYSILLAIGVRISQTLGIDIMDAPQTQNSPNPDPEMFVQREVQRRVWWTLMICEWLQRPPRPPCIRENDFDVNLPLDLDDNELTKPEFQANPESAGHRPRLIQYHLTMIALARVCHNFYLERQSASADSEDLEQLVMRTDEALASVVENLPSHLQGDAEASSSENSSDPVWAWQRDSLSLSFLFYRMHINRVLQQHWTQAQQTLERAQAVCLGSARAIVTLVDRYSASLTRHRPWWVSPSKQITTSFPSFGGSNGSRATTSYLFSAVITLAVEARYAEESVAEQYKEDIDRCLTFFNSIKDQSTVAARAISVLNRYLAMSDHDSSMSE